MGRTPLRTLRPATCLMRPVCRRSNWSRANGSARTDCSSRPDTMGVCACRWFSIYTAAADRPQTRARNSGFETLAARERFIVATLDAEDALERSRSGQPRRRRRVRPRCDQSCRGACVRRRHASVCNRVLRWWTDDVVARVSARLAHRSHGAGIRAAIPGPCNGRPVPCADLPRLADPQNTYDGHAAGRGRSGWRASPTLLQAGRATTRARGTRFSMTLRVRFLNDALRGVWRGHEVRMIRIDGLGHTCGRREVDDGVMWEFFKSHRLSR